jgi:L-ascorbate metabolism protein UlaG (beta-lactamase superfamily)
MKITKFVHSCLLVEMPDPVNRTVLFDPGAMSEEALGNHKLEFLDDIVITHAHGDHFHLPVLQKLVEQFPDVRILAPTEVVEKLTVQGIKAQDTPPEGMTLFDAPHEDVEPMFPLPQEIGVHYLDKFSDPGDSHSFTETKEILALPVQAPWGSTINAVKLALELKPKHILPIHDWHWSDAARSGMYDQLEGLFKEHDITFHKLETGKAVVIGD